MYVKILFENDSESFEVWFSSPPLVGQNVSLDSYEEGKYVPEEFEIKRAYWNIPEFGVADARYHIVVGKPAAKIYTEAAV